MRAIDQVSSIADLRAAWAEINRRTHGARRRTAGIDGQSIDDFASNIDKHLKSIREQVRSTGGFPVQDLKANFIPKPNGKDRIICVPPVRDRVLQRSINNYLAQGDKCRLANTVSYGFIPHRGVKQAVSRACNLRSRRTWAYKTDITAFFDSIDRHWLKGTIVRDVKASTLHCLLTRIVDTEIFEPKRERREKIEHAGIKTGVGVRQGMPLSPFFSNLVLRDFDREIERKSVKMVRYADDLIIFTKSEGECCKVHELCKAILALQGLEVPEPGEGSKTVFYHPDEPAEFLGVSIKKAGSTRYQPYVLRSQLEEIRSRVLTLSSIAEARRRHLTLPSLIQSLTDSVAGYEQAYDHCENIDQVIRVCSDAKIEALSRIFSDIGIDVQELDTEKKEFLGLV